MDGCHSYSMKLELLTNATVVDDAIRFVSSISNILMFLIEILIIHFGTLQEGDWRWNIDLLLLYFTLGCSYWICFYIARLRFIRCCFYWKDRQPWKVWKGTWRVRLAATTDYRIDECKNKSGVYLIQTWAKKVCCKRISCMHILLYVQNAELVLM